LNFFKKTIVEITVSAKTMFRIRLIKNYIMVSRNDEYVVERYVEPRICPPRVSPFKKATALSNSSGLAVSNSSGLAVWAKSPVAATTRRGARTFGMPRAQPKLFQSELLKSSRINSNNDGIPWGEALRSEGSQM
jgi:hypothetical protein